LDPVFQFAIDEFPDDGQLSKLWRAAWGSSPTGFQPSLKSCLCYITARYKDRLAGFVKVAGDGALHAFLLDPTVHPDFRRQGLGKELVAHAVQVSAERGAVWMHVDFEPALKPFYDRCGFSGTQAGLMRL
jgi:ribosomal protein S18 acetylase RimI-like enzyme